MAVAFDEDLARKLPLPLAQLYRRAHNAKTALDRNLTAYYLWEAGLKLLASVAVGIYSAADSDTSEAPECLTKLVRPSLGQWWAILRTLTGLLADRDEPFQRVRDLLLGRALDDLPRAAGLDAVLRQDGEGRGGARATVQLGQLFDRLVNYRNKFLHNPGIRRQEGFHEQMSDALLAGVAQVFGRLDPLVHRRLLFVGDIKRQPSGDWLVERYDLAGETARRVESLQIPQAEIALLPRPERIYLRRQGQEGSPDVLTMLHPLVLFDPETNEVLFFNSLRNNGRPEYLCYTSGKTTERPDLAQDLRELLARALHQPVAAQQGEPWLDRLQAQQGTEEANGPAKTEGTSARHVGEFELQTKLGQGGMGVVYRAWQPSLGRWVALKCLLRTGDAKAEARFAREIRALGSVEHPHLVKIFTSGAEGEQWFYAMELLEGTPLAAMIDKLTAAGNRQPELDLRTWHDTLKTVCEPVQRVAPGSTDAVQREPAKVRVRVSRGYIRHMATLIRQVAEAAHALHKAHVIHRDIKPGNIMVNPQGDLAVLMDLGLAQLADDLEGRLTRTRQFIGTLHYASPEQILAVGNLDARSDVYSLGATLYELLTLRPLFNASDQTPTPELMERIQFRDPEPLHKRQPAVPRDLNAIVLRCLEKERDKRYGSAQELADDLGRFLQGRPVRARPVGKAGRFWRWCRRQPAIAGLSATLLAAVIVSFVVVTWKWVEADSALLDAQAANQRAEQRELDLHQINGELKQRELDLQDTNNKLEHRKEQLSKAIQNLDALAKAEQNSNYNHSVALAHNEWLTGNLGRWEALLNHCPPRLRGWDWDYLKGLGQGELFSFRKDKPQYCIAFSKDGRWLAYAGEDQRIAVRKAGTGELVHLMPQVDQPQHKNTVWAVAFSPDGALLASASGDKTVKIWDVVKGKELFTFNKHGDEVNNVTFSPDGKRIASSGRDNSVKVWDLQGTVHFQAVCAGGIFSGLAFDPEGRLLACPLDTKGTVAVWNINNGQQQFHFLGHSRRVAGIAFSPNGRYIACASWDSTITIWDTKTLQRIQTGDDLSPTGLVHTFHHDNFVNNVAFSPDSQRVASASWDQTVKLWNLTTGKEINCFRGHANIVLGVAFSADGGYLASAGFDGNLRIWETERPLERRETLGADSTTRFHAATFDPAGKHLIGCGIGVMEVWDADTHAVLWPLEVAGDWGSVTVSSDGRFIATGEGCSFSAGQKKGRIMVWDLPGRASHKVLQGHADWVTGVAFRPGFHQLASASKDGTIKVWDLAQDPSLWQLQHTPREPADSFRRPSPVWGIAYSWNGKYLASAGDDMKIKVWDAETGKEIQVLEEHSQPARCVAFSRDGRFLVSGGGDSLNIGEIIVWDVKSWKVRHRFVNISGSITGVALHPHGRLLTASSYNRLVVVCDVAMGEELFRLRGSASPLTAVAWDPSGRRLVSTDGSNLAVWSAYPAAEVFSMHHTRRVNSAAFHPEGKLLASVSNDTTVQIWDTATGQPAEPPLESSSRPNYSNTVTWSPTGKLLAYDNGKAIRIRSWPGKQIVRDLEQQELVDFLTFSPQGTLLAVAYRKDPRIRFYDTSTWQTRLVLEGHDGPLISLAFSPDGKWLASAGLDKTVRIWDVGAGGQTLHVLKGHADSVTEVSFLDDRRVASSSKDGTVRIWDAVAGAPIRTLHGHLASVWSVAYHPLEQKLVSVDELGLIKVWDPTTGEELATLRGHAGSVGFVTFNRKNQYFASAGADGTIRLWDIRRLREGPSQQQEQERWVRWFIQRGRAQAEQARWHLALADYRRAVAMKPADSSIWSETALLALQCGDKEYYRTICQSMIARLDPAEKLDPEKAILTVWACLQSPDSGIEPRRLVEWAEKAVAQKQSPLYLYVLGGALYRAGQPDRALKELNNANALNQQQGKSSLVQASLFLAMVHWQLGNKEEARKWLADCKATIVRAQQTQPALMKWQFKLPLDNFVREAEAMFGVTPHVDNRRGLLDGLAPEFVNWVIW